MKSILLIGGCGYVGTVLANHLLSLGFRVTVFDTQWFGNHLEAQDNLSIIKGDIRDFDNTLFSGQDTVIHLANIANDPSVELNPVMSWEVNVLSTQMLADGAYRAGVSQFIFASSGSVYGVKSEPDVTEDLPLVPISVYNKTKMVAERILLSYSDRMAVHCIRPATVCGISPRMRLDVSVNILTYSALVNDKITVFGGSQVRPNIHMSDMIGVYEHFLLNKDIPSGCYNAGFENISILEIAEMVSEATGSEIEVTESNDPRSYRQNSDKLLATGFSPKYRVRDAIEELIHAYNQHALPDDESCFSVKWMNKLGLGS